MTEFVALCTIVVDLEPTLSVGVGPAGDRSIGGYRSATVRGDRLNATLAAPAAADWLVRTGAIGIIDARMTLRTDDGALIYVRYGGRLDLSNPTAGINAYIAPTFETGDARYAWLNAVQAAGKGRYIVENGDARIEYDLFEVR